MVLSSQDVYAQFGRLNGHAAPPAEELVSEASALTVPFPFRGLAEHEGGADYDKKDVESQYRIAGERSFRSTTILRLPAVYGRGDYQERFKRIVDALDEGVRTLPCQNHAQWRWTLAHVHNVAYAIVLAAEKSVLGYQVFNVGESHTPKMCERVARFAELMGVSVVWVETERLPEELWILGNMPNDFVVSTEKIRTLLQYREILDESAGYQDLIEWIRFLRRGIPGQIAVL